MRSFGAQTSRPKNKSWRTEKSMSGQAFYLCFLLLKVQGLQGTPSPAPECRDGSPRLTSASNNWAQARAERTLANGLTHAGTGQRDPGLQRFRGATSPSAWQPVPGGPALAGPLRPHSAPETSRYFSRALRAASIITAPQKVWSCHHFFSVMQPFLLYSVIWHSSMKFFFLEPSQFYVLILCLKSVEKRSNTYKQ